MFVCFVLIKIKIKILKKEEKQPLQSVIPINIIHLKNTIYIFIYRFLYIYFYIQDVLASCQRNISVEAGDGLGFIALGFQNRPFARNALKTQRHPARRYQNKKEKNLGFKTYIQLLQSLLSL